VRYHGCGAGAPFDEQATVAVLVARLNSLAQGFSGVRFSLLEAIERLINYRVLPCIPSEGSVGASGDLTPLSYVAARWSASATCCFAARAGRRPRCSPSSASSASRSRRRKGSRS